MKRLLLSLLLVFSPACARGPAGGGEIPQEKLAPLFADLMETAQAGRRGGIDSARARTAADSVLQRAGVTREQFRAAVRFLNRDIERWKKVTEDAARILDERGGGPASGR